MIAGIHHVAIIASHYERSKKFYTEVLGFKIIQEVFRKERDSYKLDLSGPEGCQLELFSFPNPPARPSYPEACGLRHIAFKVHSIEEAAAWLERNEISHEPIRIDEWTGKKFCFFSDPDGLPIEIYEVN